MVSLILLMNSNEIVSIQIDQLILSYGGLRGAIAFGLAMSIPETILARQMFITTTIVVIFFTVFLQVCLK